MKLAPYPKYEPSGVEWLGDLPAHWEVMKLKKLVSFIEEKESEIDGENRLPYIGLEHIESWTGMLCVRDSEFVPTSVSNRFHSGDVLFGKLRPYLAKACKPSFEGICSSELLVLRPSSGIDGRFLLHLLLTKGFISLVDSSTYGAKMPRANWNDVSSCALPVPSLKEQRAIADFLDCEAAKIDKLIDKKRMLIERLKEKRAALITRTVTQGLPPDAARAAGLEPEPKMKASGVEWLGDVPAHWGVLPLRRWYRVVNGGTPSSTEETYWHGGINWITPEDLGRNRSKRIGNSRRTLSIEGLTNCGAQLVPVNSITLSTRAPVGHLAITSRKSCTNQGCRTLVPKGSGAHPDYLYYVLLAFRPLLEAAGKGTTFMELSANLLGSHIAPFPPDTEQRAIADFLDRETAKIDGLIAKVDTAIARLREYRAALITAAVTGQVDVRGNDDHKS